MKLSKYFCPKCGQEKMLQDGYYCLCRKCSRYFYLYGIEDGMLDGWPFGDPEKKWVKEWEKYHPPKGCLKIKGEQRLKGMK